MVELDAEESEIRVGFVTYAKEIHFYNVKVNIYIYTSIDNVTFCQIYQIRL
jgi:hypothetical protein